MFERLLTFLRCPDCGGDLEVEAFGPSGEHAAEISEGLLHCNNDHWYPVVGGIPRMLPDALQEHWPRLEGLASSSTAKAVRSRQGNVPIGKGSAREYDRRTRANFSLEWEHHELGDRTWGMDLDDRVQWFFLDSIHIPKEELQGKVMLDAGCGNGSQSVAYSEFGMEVVALDLSTGLERGHAFRHQRDGARPTEFISFRATYSARLSPRVPSTSSTRPVCSTP